MNIEIKAIHFTLKDDGREYLEKKIKRIHNAEQMLIDLLVTVSKEASGFKAEANVNFRWGMSVHVSESDHDLHAAIDKMMDVLDAKISKEKEKHTDRR